MAFWSAIDAIRARQAAGIVAPVAAPRIAAPVAFSPLVPPVFRPEPTVAYATPLAAPPAAIPFTGGVRTVPYAEPLAAPGGSAPMGRSSEYVQYDIRNPFFAQFLREAFDTSGGSGWMLASEIVPVFVVNPQGASGEIPFAFGQTIAAAVANCRGHVAFINISTDRIIYLDRFEMQLSGGEFYGFIRNGELPPHATDDIKNVLELQTTDRRYGIADTYVGGHWGRLGSTAPAGAELLAQVGASPIFIRGTGGIRQTRFPRIALQPGEVYYLVAGGLASADALTHIWVEGRVADS